MSGWRDKVFDSLHIAETTRTDAGAVALTSPRCVVVTTVASALTLADGYPGALIFISMRTYVGIATLTPTNLKNYTTVKFCAVGDWVAMEFDGLEWAVLASKGVVLT